MRDSGVRSWTTGPLLVAIAAMLWGTDGIFRTALIAAMPANAIVLWEHILLTLAVGWILWRDRAALRRLDGGDWISAFVIAAGASALATVLITAANQLASPTTVLLLQKTQPLIAISLAAVMLREPLPERFWAMLPVALVGTYFITFGTNNPLEGFGQGQAATVGALMALGASALWGAGTVLGRRLLGKLEFPTVTALRFTLALPALVIWAALAGYATPGPAQIAPLLGTALLSGLLGLLLYYRGLRETPAAVATLCELCFPITAVLLNVVFLGVGIGAAQVVGIALLWGALASMRHRNVPVAQPAPVPA
jgi:drug/metabolite transporter (DMT)-like permease